MIEIRRLVLEEIIFHRDKILSLFEKNIKKHPPVLDDPMDWYNKSIDGTFQLWGFLDTELKGVAITAIDGNSVNGFCISGKSILKDFPDFIKVLSDFARSQGIRYIQTLSSPAFARIAYKDFHQRPLIMVTLDTQE